jgi:hypothetical protein
MMHGQKNIVTSFNHPIYVFIYIYVIYFYQEDGCGMRHIRWRRRHKWEDDIKMYMGVDWINMAQDRAKWWGFVNTVLNLRFP